MPSICDYAVRDYACAMTVPVHVYAYACRQWAMPAAGDAGSSSGSGSIHGGAVVEPPWARHGAGVGLRSVAAYLASMLDYACM